MDTLAVVTAAAALITGMTLPAGVWRILAYRSGQVDHTPGMRNVGILALSLGIVSATVLAVCVVLLATR
ncbi:hypothetical protein [Nocardioides massiliensis]|uniref:DUF4190 domain-containing protein n=1 Tax=Nocardioides massiliensis TaxID=1325935 RepID=A0ABT9NPW8_9ACTN|nr:hypothetical protein [Nocardioides massiliensis]MDP9822471.1 hypothetical protein [Nocardioides massiliensis]